jgi:hypothetical protein
MWAKVGMCVEKSPTPFWDDAEILPKKTCFRFGPESVEKDSNQLTFFSLSIHLLIAGVEDPVRSLRARSASLMIARVAIVGIGDGCVLLIWF